MVQQREIAGFYDLTKTLPVTLATAAEEHARIEEIL
jgi:hypothetical protein